MKLIIIPQEIRERISNELKIVHEKKKGYSKDVKVSIIKQIQTLENRIEEAFTLKLDGNITHEIWKTQNDKWQNEKDRLKIQLDEMDKLDKEFYEKADILLGFTDNVYEYFSKGNIKQKRKILEIISEEITYKDKKFNVKLKPIFKTIAQNQYNLTQKFANF